MHDARLIRRPIQSSLSGAPFPCGGGLMFHLPDKRARRWPHSCRQGAANYGEVRSEEMDSSKILSAVGGTTVSPAGQTDLPDGTRRSGLKYRRKPSSPPALAFLQDRVFDPIPRFDSLLRLPYVAHDIIPFERSFLRQRFQTGNRPAVACDNKWFALFQLIQNTFGFLVQLLRGYRTHALTGNTFLVSPQALSLPLESAVP